MRTMPDQAEQRLGEEPPIGVPRLADHRGGGVDRGGTLGSWLRKSTRQPPAELPGCHLSWERQLTAAAPQRRLAGQADLLRPAPIFVNPPYSGGRGCVAPGEVPLQGSKGSVDPE